MRNLPVYFLIDAPLSMTGNPMDKILSLIESFIELQLRNPISLEIMEICVISGNSNHSEVVLPLTPISDIVNIGHIKCQGKSNIFNGIDILKDCVKNQVNNTIHKKKVNYKPILIIMVGTIPQIEFPKHYLEFFSSDFSFGGNFIEPFEFMYNSIHNLGDEIIKDNPSVIYFQNTYVGNYYKKIFGNVQDSRKIENYLKSN